MASSTAKLSNYRQAPRKVRLVADAIRGKTVLRAVSLLASFPKRASGPMQKLLQSAVSNASKSGFSAKDLFISHIAVNKGTTFKRYMPRARGRSSLIHKRSSHITLTLSQKKSQEKTSEQ